MTSHPVYGFVSVSLFLLSLTVLSATETAFSQDAGIDCECSSTGYYGDLRLISGTREPEVSSIKKPRVDSLSGSAGMSPRRVYRIDWSVNGPSVTFTIREEASGDVVLNESTTGAAFWGFSPDDHRFVMKSFDGAQSVLSMWDLQQRPASRVVSETSTSEPAIGFSGKGRYLSAAYQSGEMIALKVFDRGGALRLTENFSGGIESSWSFSPDEDRFVLIVAGASGVGLDMYDLTSSTKVLDRNYASADFAVGFSPNSNFLSIASVGSPSQVRLELLDKGGTSVYNELFSLSLPPASDAFAARWGFTSGDSHFAIVGLAAGTSTLNVIDLRETPAKTVISESFVDGDFVFGLSPNRKYVLLALMSGTSQSRQLSVNVFDSNGAPVYDTNFTYSLPQGFPDSTDFNVQDSLYSVETQGVTWGFGPDDEDRTLMMASLEGATGGGVRVVNLATASELPTQSLENVLNARWQFSPCGDMFGLISSQGFFNSAHVSLTPTLDGGANYSADFTERDPSQIELFSTETEHRVAHSPSESTFVGPNTAGESCSVTILPSSLEVSDESLTGGRSGTATVTISPSARTGGETLTIESSDPGKLSAPATVTVGGGSTRATFDYTAIPVSSDSPVTLTVRNANGAVESTVTVLAPQLASLEVEPDSIAGGNWAGVSVSLTGPAPADNITVSLASSNPAVASVPPSLVLFDGSVEESEGIETVVVSEPTTAVITATLGGRRLTDTLVVRRARATSISLSSDSRCIVGIPDSVSSGSPVLVAGRSFRMRVQFDGELPSTGVPLQFESSDAGIASLGEAESPEEGNTNLTVSGVSTGSAGTVEFSVAGSGFRQATSVRFEIRPVLYRVVDLGEFQPVALNDAGQVAGRTWFRINELPDGLLWQDGAISVLPSVDGFENAIPHAINDYGEIVGTTGRFGSSDRGYFHFDQGFSQALTFDYTSPAVMDVNNRGDIMLTPSGRNALLISNGGIVEIDPIPNYGRTKGLALNDAGHALVKAWDLDFSASRFWGPEQGFVWTPDTVRVLEWWPNTNSTRLDFNPVTMNNRGDVAGSVRIARVDGTEEWVPSQGFDAVKLTDYGLLIGSNRTARDGTVYPIDGKAYQLSCLLDPSTEFTTTGVADVNESGVVLAAGWPVADIPRNLTEEEQSALGPQHAILAVPDDLALSDLVLAAESLPDSVQVRSAATLGLTIANSGASAAPDVSVHPSLPAHVEIVSLQSSVGSCQTNPLPAFCEIGTLSSGSTASITLQIRPLAVQNFNVRALVRSRSLDSRSIDNSLYRSIVVVDAEQLSASSSVAAGYSGFVDLSDAGVLIEMTEASNTDGTISASQHDTAPPDSGKITRLAVSTSAGSITPDILSSDRYWTVTADGLTGFTYRICLNIEGVPGTGNVDALAIAKQDHPDSSWVPLPTTTELIDGLRYLCAEGLTSFSGFAIASDSELNALDVEGSEALRPDEYRISGPYPNPTREGARFMLQVGRTQTVVVDVFDLLGRHVMRHSTAVLAPGADHVVDVGRTGLSSGLYIVRVKGESFAHDLTLMVLR